MHYVKVKGILSSKNGMNLYRGCSHGCIYCDSRSVCYHMEHDFEDIEVKENAIELLEYALRHKRKRCMIGTGSMTDPYIPLEMKLGNVRRALQLIYDYGFGVTVITKSDRILRDLDLLQKINERAKCVVQMTLTTYDEALWRARNIASPQNARRLGKKTPCAVKGDRCYDCKSPDRICRGLVTLWGPMTGMEAEVLLVDEDLGL